MRYHWPWAMLLAGCGPASSPDTGRVAIIDVTVIDVAATDPAEARELGQTVIVEGSRIAAIGPSRSTRLPRGTRVLEGRGKFLIPGLWDAHSHLTYAGAAGLGAYVANGVTGVRDLGGRLSELAPWKQGIASGSVIGPLLLVAGPNLEGAWWLDRVVELAGSDSLLRQFPFLELSPRFRLASASDAAQAVDSLSRLGVDLIKSRNLRGDEFRAVASAARQHGVPYAGHAPIDVPIGEAADSGIQSLEHMETVMLRLGNLDDSARSAELARVASQGTAITPTMITDRMYRQTPDSVAYAVITDSAGRIDPRRRLLSKELLRMWKFGLDSKKFEGPEDWGASHRNQVADLRRAHAAKVPLLVGTDLGVSLVYPGSSVHDEIRLLVEEGGLTPLEALRSATLTPARIFGLADSIGTIAVGKRADLVLLEADPLADVAGVKEIVAVVLAGRAFDRAGLDSLIARSEEIAARQAAPAPVRR